MRTIKEMDCDIPEGTWIFDTTRHFKTRRTVGLWTSEDFYSNYRLATCAEIIEAGGDAPKKGDKLLCLSTNQIYTVDCVAWEFEKPVKFTAVGETITLWFDNFRPALPHEIPQEEPTKEPIIYKVRGCHPVNGDKGYGQGCFYFDVSTNCSYVNIGDGECSEWRMVYSPDVPKYAKKDVIHELEIDFNHPEFDTTPLSTRIADVVRPVVAHRTNAVMGIDGVDIEYKLRAGDVVIVKSWEEICELNEKTEFGLPRDARHLCGTRCTVAIASRDCGTDAVELVQDECGNDWHPSWLKLVKRNHLVEPEPYRNESPDGDWWSQNSFGQAEKEKTRRQWWHNIGGRE